MELIDLQSGGVETIQWSCIQTKIIESAIAFIDVEADEFDVYPIRHWARIHKFLIEQPNDIDNTVTEEDMLFIEKISQNHNICEFCSALIDKVCRKLGAVDDEDMILYFMQP